jgi:hypothetical protein
LETETGNFPSIGKNRGQRSEVSGQIFRGLEKYAGDFPRLGKVRAVFSEPRKSNREGARTGRRLAQNHGNKIINSDVASLLCHDFVRMILRLLPSCFPHSKNLPGLGKRVVNEEIRKAGTETSGCGLYVSRTLEKRCRISSHLNTGRGFL